MAGARAASLSFPAGRGSVGREVPGARGAAGARWAGRGRRRHLKAALPAAPGRAPPEGGGSARGPPPAPARHRPRLANPPRLPGRAPPPRRGALGGAGTPGAPVRAAWPPPSASQLLSPHPPSAPRIIRLRQRGGLPAPAGCTPREGTR